jgi:hypothetical protein
LIMVTQHQLASPQARAALVILSLQLTHGSLYHMKNLRASIRPTLVVATRIHLGHNSSHYSEIDLETKMDQFLHFAESSCRASAGGVIAVDATPRADGYTLLDAVQAACEKALAKFAAASQDEQCSISTGEHNDSMTTTTTATSPKKPRLHVLPVTPWGQFVPALNALISYAAGLDQILFCSAECATTSAASVDHLFVEMTPDTLVVGAVLPGHDTSKKIDHEKDRDAATTTTTGVGRRNERQVVVALTGRTTPWNTLAVWDLRKLSLTGFLLVSEGLFDDDDNDNGSVSTAGVEEAVAIAVLQKLLGPEQSKAKLVALPEDHVVQWQVNSFEGDRRKWHEQKMKSKEQRAAKQLERIGFVLQDAGVVHHIYK